MRFVEDIRASLNRSPDVLSTKRYLLELIEVILFRLNSQNELGPWEVYQLSKATGYLRLNIEGASPQFSTSWLSAAEVSVVKSLVPPEVRSQEAAELFDQTAHVGYEQLMIEIQRLRSVLN